MRIRIASICISVVATLAYVYRYSTIHDAGVIRRSPVTSNTTRQDPRPVYNDEALGAIKKSDIIINMEDDICCSGKSINLSIPQKYAFREYPGFSNDDTLNSEKNGAINEKNYTIMVYNYASWFKATTNTAFLKSPCPYKNCVITDDKSSLMAYSAIVFNANSKPNSLPETPPILSSSRNPDQVWILQLMEAPIRHTKHWGIYQNDYWRNTFNWTWSYTLDSDIPSPKGFVRKRETPVIKNYREIVQQKTKMAAWVVSHCVTESQREIYVKRLQAYGVDVDIYGQCAGERIDGNLKRDIINRDYKFYLAFENSICKQYVTEKFFQYFQLNVVLIVRGGADYNKYVSRDAIINTADFRSIKGLADHLKAVAANQTLYTEYLRNKDQYEAFSHYKRENLCMVCGKLNNLDENRRVHTHLVEEITNGTCTYPKDII